MTTLTLAEAQDAIYASIRNDNKELDTHIVALKKAMEHEGLKEVSFELSKLVQPNRQGRKLMQSYFRKKGVTVGFV